MKMMEDVPMTILHMETDQARATQQTLSARQQEIAGSVSQILGSVNSLRTKWQGNSASQFFQEYDQWNSAMGKLMEELRQMGSQLQTEIAEWEQTAAKLE
jgi:WXG100 family type VII secretion target